MYAYQDIHVLRVYIRTHMYIYISMIPPVKYRGERLHGVQMDAALYETRTRTFLCGDLQGTLDNGRYIV